MVFGHDTFDLGWFDCSEYAAFPNDVRCGQAFELEHSSESRCPRVSVVERIDPNVDVLSGAWEAVCDYGNTAKNQDAVLFGESFDDLVGAFHFKCHSLISASI